MRIAYFDCFSGASGDMILASCIGAGFSLDALRQELAGLKVSGFTVHAEAVRKQGFAATQFEVRVDPQADQPHRHLRHIREIITASQLKPRIQERALAIFTRLAEAEAAVHGTTPEKVHFHEVGAIDAIVDVVGACIAFEHLGIERVYCSPIPTGSGTVHCDHGEMPIPAPATAALLQGVPLADCDEIGELTTPTGAAILTTLAGDFGPIPAMRLERMGIGAGRREGQRRANILRLIIGEAAGSADDAESDRVLVLEANLDDVPGEVIGYTYERLLSAGALDVFTTPVIMKKNRPGLLLTVLAAPELREKLESLIFAETTTFGIRGYVAERTKLAREQVAIETEFGPIRIKVGRRGQRIVRAAPEYEDCRVAAERTGRPLVEVMEEAMRAWRQRKPTE